MIKQEFHQSGPWKHNTDRSATSVLRVSVSFTLTRTLWMSHCMKLNLPLLTCGAGVVWLTLQSWGWISTEPVSRPLTPTLSPSKPTKWCAGTHDDSSAAAELRWLRSHWASQTQTHTHTVWTDARLKGSLPLRAEWQPECLCVMFINWALPRFSRQAKLLFYKIQDKVCWYVSDHTSCQPHWRTVTRSEV